MERLDLVLRLLCTSKSFDRRAGLARVSGPTRFFMCRLILEYGEGAAEASVHEMADDFLVTDRAVSRALKELEEIGVLVDLKEANGKGRPKTKVRLSEGFLQTVEEQVAAPVCSQYRELIDHILSGDFLAKEGKRRSRLTPQNRLLLAALIARAGANGVVWDTGEAELKRVCGLSADQFKSQIRKLASTGYLRSRVSGVSGRYIFGKTPGAFFLNPAHPDFRDLGLKQWLILREERFVTDENEFGYARKLYLTARPIRDDLLGYLKSLETGPTELGSWLDATNYARDLYRAESLENEWSLDSSLKWESCPSPKVVFEAVGPTLYTFFGDSAYLPLAALLQAYIDRCTSEMLSLGITERDFPQDDFERFENDLSHVLAAQGQIYPVTKLVAAVLAAALKQVTRIQKSIDALVDQGKISHGSLEGAGFALLPVPQSSLVPGASKFGNRLALVITPAPGQPFPEHRVWKTDIWAVHTNKINVQRFPDEFELDANTRTGFGLKVPAKS